MKKLILIILVSSFLFSCSSNSSNDNSTNPSSTGLLVKTMTETSPFNSGTQTYNYNGNKLINYTSSNGSFGTCTYNGDLIIKKEATYGSGENYIGTLNYSNNLLTSSIENWNLAPSFGTHNNTYTYNSDGSITEFISFSTTNSGNTYSSSNKYIRFYSQGNCVKKDNYSLVNGVMTQTGSTTYTYDTNNQPFKNIAGIYAMGKPTGASLNNVVNEIEKNTSQVITKTVQTTYQYNSQNYPISSIETSTDYIVDSQTGTSTPEATPTVRSEVYTYY